MNLGIEDAWVFSELVKYGRLGEYAARREKIDREVVDNVETLTNLVNSQKPILRFMRNNIVPIAAHLPFLTKRMMRVAAGLDHPLSF